MSGLGSCSALFRLVRAQSRRHGEARRSSYQTENIKKCQNGKQKKLVPKRTLN